MSVIDDDGGGGQGGVGTNGYSEGADGVWFASAGSAEAASYDGRGGAVDDSGTLLSDGELLARLEL